MTGQDVTLTPDAEAPGDSNALPDHVQALVDGGLIQREALTLSLESYFRDNLQRKDAEGKPDPIVDYTLTVKAGGGGRVAFNLVPAGGGTVLDAIVKNNRCAVVLVAPEEEPETEPAAE